MEFIHILNYGTVAEKAVIYLLLSDSTKSIPSYEEGKEVMNENLIFEGNTIYELDPVCMREKRNHIRRNPAGNGWGNWRQTADIQSLRGWNRQCQEWILLFGFAMMMETNCRKKR